MSKTTPQPRSKRRSQPKALPTEREADLMIPEIRRRSVRDGDQHVLRGPTVVRAVWRDPGDTGEHRTAPPVSGWKRFSVLDRLRKLSDRGSGLIVADHVRAADRYSREAELASAYPARALDGSGSGGHGYPSASHDEKAATYQWRVKRARQTLGEAACGIVDAVVLGNMTVKVFARSHRPELDEKVAMGLLVASLTRLVEHYGPDSLRASVFEDAV